MDSIIEKTVPGSAHQSPSMPYNSVEQAHNQIKQYIHKPPLITSSTLNKLLGHEIYFKLESLQKTGSFKVRGILNALSNLQKNNILPKKVVTYGTGNHAIALSWACTNIFNIKAQAFLPCFTSEIKKDLIRLSDAEIIITETRAEAEEKAVLASKEPGAILLPPSDNEDVIIGAGTVAYEVFSEISDLDAIFVPIGGGSLSSGTLLARDLMSPTTEVYAGEPKDANDAAISYRTGKIFRFRSSPRTIADGARTLGISERVFHHIKKLSGIYEITEREIEYWTAWFTHLTKISCEPTSALSIAAAYRFLRSQTEPQKIAIIISGANVNQEAYQKIWSQNYLVTQPSDFNFEEERE